MDKFLSSLSEDERLLIYLALLKADNIDVQSILLPSGLKKFTKKQVTDLLRRAAAAGVLKRQTDHFHNREIYGASLLAMVLLYPYLGRFKKEWKSFQNQSMERGFKFFSLREMSAFLFTFLFDEKQFRLIQENALQWLWHTPMPNFSWIFLVDGYEPVMDRLDVEIFMDQVQKMRDSMDRSSEELAFCRERIELHVKRMHLDEEDQAEINAFIGRSFVHEGRFDEALPFLKLSNPAETLFLEAMQCIVKRDYEIAVKFYEEGMRMLRREYRGLLLPLTSDLAFFYVFALTQVAPTRSASLFKKLLAAVLSGKEVTHTSIVLSVLVAHHLNQKLDMEPGLRVLDQTFAFTQQSQHHMMALLVRYVVKLKPNKEELDIYENIVPRLVAKGYRTMGYECLYVLSQWVENDRIRDLYASMQSGMGYEPVLSNLVQVEDWEKALNSFLMFAQSKRSIMSKKEVEEKYRLIYWVDSEGERIQPSLQTRNKSGWSKGRNVALKSLMDGVANGMTDQDFRISKHIKRYDGGWGYGVVYEIQETVFRDLAGHPYLFLEGSDFVPVEMIEAHPEVRVKKTAVGYALTCNLKTSSRIVVKKETNTRFLVYDLSVEQLELVNRINLQKLLVPERGKNKLMEVLQVFSGQMQVHSDLLLGAGVPCRTVHPDSRIRVQLLPFGEGIKAELFVKPFSTMPPYCKPGKGGKNLMTQDETGQVQVERDLAVELERATLLLTEISKLEAVDMDAELMVFKRPEDCLFLLDVLEKHREYCVVEWPEGVRYRLSSSVGFEALKLRVKGKTNWFELEGDVQISEDVQLSLSEMMSKVRDSKNRFVEIKPGEFVALNEQFRKRLEELNELVTVQKGRVQMNRLASLAWKDALEDFGEIRVDSAWKAFQQRVEESQERSYALPAGLNADLRVYQEEGFYWMARLAAWGAGACLADDMGLGKTLQALALLLHRASEGPALVVCPVSLLGNWEAEAMRFAPSLQIKRFANGDRNLMLQELAPMDVLLVSYGLLQSESEALKAISFATVVLDEAHTIKNASTKTSKSAMALQAGFRLALTGTPIQNHLGEIWNLFQFLNPGLLGSLELFTHRFVKGDASVSRRQLRRLLSPFLLRRTKSSVLDELPAKTEVWKRVELSEQEMAFYEQLRRQAVLALEQSSENNGQKHLKALAEITRLRQAACHPALVDPSIGLGSSKLTLFLEILSDLKDAGHRPLVFSQFVSHLALVRAALDDLGYSYQYLDGSTSTVERSKRVKAFQAGSGDLFLISLKAGGLGLNLTAADFVIHLDPWWNPAIEDQASDRAHRIGQQRPVTIYRLVSVGTIEEKILRLHATKRDLAESLLEGSDVAARLTLADLVGLF